MYGQLRNQLHMIMTATECMAPLVEQEDGDQYRQYLSTINKNLYQMVRLTANAELTTLPQEEQSMQMTLVDLVDLCHTISDEVASVITSLHMTLSYEGCSADGIVVGDRHMLARLILNLLSNAIKSAGKGGTVGVKVSVTKRHVILTVWDNGQGIPHTESTQNHLKEGLGLGLEVARQVALWHNGTLLFDHKEGQGGRGIISIPLATVDSLPPLRAPIDTTGGLSPVMVELSTVLPSSCYNPEDLA